MTPKVFNSALADPTVSTINLNGTIDNAERYDISRPVTINGGTMTFSNSGQNLVVLSDGVTFSGTTFENTSANPTTWASTYGTQVYESNDVVFENCTFKGGNAGLLVNGGTATLRGTTTIEGAGFGGIEVSKGVNVPNAGVLNIEGTIVNADEAYGKPTVWVDGTTSDIGVVNGAESMTMVVIKDQNQYYLDPANAMKTWTDMSAYVSETDTGDYDGQDVALVIDGQTFTNSSIGLSSQQNRENPPKLHLTVTNSTFEGGTEYGKFIYVTNIQSMLLDNCTFSNNSVSDYGVDVNLCTIQNSNIQIKNCSFTNVGQKAALKISQRKGSTDHPTDITVTTPATIENVLVENCSFSGNIMDYNVGTTPKGDDVSANTTTGAYPVTISNCTTNVVVAEPYLVDKDVDVPTTTVLAGTTVSKTADGQFYQQTN